MAPVLDQAGGGAAGGRSSDAPWNEWTAMRHLVRLTAPLAAGSVINVCADRLSLALVGHWDFADRSHYDGAGVGKMYSNITGLSLGIAASIGLATFCAQAHGEGRSHELNAVFVRRAAVLLSGVFLFAAAAAAVCEPLLLALGQPALVAKTSARFAQVQLIGVPAYWAWTAMKLALDSAKLTRPGLVTAIVSSLAQVVMSVVLTHPQMADMGYLGIALGRALGGWVSALSLLMYVQVFDMQSLVYRLHPNAEPVMQIRAFRRYLAVSLPSALIIWSEWWAFEVLGIFVGWTKDAEVNLAAHSTMFNVLVVCYMTFTGTSTAVCTLVGNLLGERRNGEIRPLLRAACMLSLGTSTLVAVLYEAGKGLMAAAFTEDASVQAVIRQSSVGVVLSVPLYAQLMTFYGALRGANKQRPGILGTLLGYWVLGLPLGGYLGCVRGWPTPLVGVWLGNVVALAIAASWVWIAVFACIDWQTVVRVTCNEEPVGALNAQGRDLSLPLNQAAPAKDGDAATPGSEC